MYLNCFRLASNWTLVPVPWRTLVDGGTGKWLLNSSLPFIETRLSCRVCFLDSNRCLGAVLSMFIRLWLLLRTLLLAAVLLSALMGLFNWTRGQLFCNEAYIELPLPTLGRLDLAWRISKNRSRNLCEKIQFTVNIGYNVPFHSQNRKIWIEIPPRKDEINDGIDEKVEIDQKITEVLYENALGGQKVGGPQFWRQNRGQTQADCQSVTKYENAENCQRHQGVSVLILLLRLLLETPGKYVLSTFYDNFHNIDVQDDQQQGW